MDRRGFFKLSLAAIGLGKLPEVDVPIEESMVGPYWAGEKWHEVGVVEHIPPGSECALLSEQALRRDWDVEEWHELEEGAWIGVGSLDLRVDY